MKIYIACGMLISALFFGAGAKGFVFTGMSQHMKWGSGGHGMYHK